MHTIENQPRRSTSRWTAQQLRELIRAADDEGILRWEDHGDTSGEWVELDVVLLRS